MVGPCNQNAQMKIALLTLWHVENYGAELQTYATVKALKQLGFEVEVIDFRLSDIEQKSLLGRIASCVRTFSPLRYKFNRFWKKYIPSSRRYRTDGNLMQNPPSADIYMTGSDQVWNPDITKERAKNFFLNFGSPDIKRISYASSFGVTEWKHADIYEDIKSLLKNFDYVTCREESGVKLLKEQFGIDAVNVVDPTLLFASYPEFVEPVSTNNCLVFYPLSEDTELEQLSKSVSGILGLKLINNNKISKILGRIEWNRNSIEEWVKNIAESEFVLTRSFHGLIFSLLYNRQFALLKVRNGRNSRVENLLEKIGLEDRMYETAEAMLNDAPWKRKIDYSIVNPRISDLRKESWNTLKAMLSDEK